MKVRYFADSFRFNGKIQSKSVASICKGLKLKIKDFKIIDTEIWEPCDLAVMFGNYNKHLKKTLIRKIIVENQIKNNKDYMILERGYIKRNEGYQSIGLNGFANYGEYFNDNSPPDRWKKLNVSLRDWYLKGDHILIIGQIPTDSVLNSIDFIAWIKHTVTDIKKHTDRPIVFRNHPLYRRNIQIDGTKESFGSLDDDFKRAKVCITYNSTTGVEAIIKGIPTISLSKGSMVYSITGHDLKDIENPKILDRTQWAYDIAYCQWHFDEITRGDFWNHYEKPLKTSQSMKN